MGELGVLVSRGSNFFPPLQFERQTSLRDGAGDLIAYVDKEDNLYVAGWDGEVYMIQRSRVIDSTVEPKAFKLSPGVSIYDVQRDDTVRTYSGNGFIEGAKFALMELFLIDKIRGAWATMWDPRASNSEALKAMGALAIYVTMDVFAALGYASALKAMAQGALGFLRFATQVVRTRGMMAPAARTASMVEAGAGSGVVAAEAGAAATEGSATLAAGSLGVGTQSVLLVGKVLGEMCLEIALEGFADRIAYEASTGHEKWRNNLFGNSKSGQAWLDGEQAGSFKGQFAEWVANGWVKEKSGIDLTGEKLLHFANDNGLDTLVFTHGDECYVMEVKYSGDGAKVDVSDFVGAEDEDIVRKVEKQLKDLERWAEQARGEGKSTARQRRKQRWMLERMDEVDKTIAELDKWLENRKRGFKIRRVVHLVGPEGSVPRLDDGLNKLAREGKVDVVEHIFQGLDDAALQRRVVGALEEGVARRIIRSIGRALT